MPSTKKSPPPSTDFSSWWRRWERLTRHGIRVNNKRYTSAQLLQAWAGVLAILYFIIWISGKNRVRMEQLSNEDIFRDRHVLFCVSAGREGSKYLSNVLGVGEKVIGLHEPEPKMNGEILKAVLLEGRRAETFEERKQLKIGAIRDVLEGMDEEVVYAETSHMFVKTFADVVLESVGEVAKITVVFLKRPIRDTIWSQMRLGWFGEGHSGKEMWYYDVNSVHESERVLEVGNETDVLGLLLGYNLDVTKRGMELKNIIKEKHAQGLWKQVEVVELSLGDISGEKAEDGVKRFMQKIGVIVDEEKLNLLKEMDRNERDVKKDRVKVKMTIEDVDTRIDKLRKEMPKVRSFLE